MADLKALKQLSQQLTVLYVEDDEDLRIQLAEFFSELFKRVDTAADGAEGLKLYQSYAEENSSYYDIVVTDIAMPKLNGIDMSKAMLQLNKEQRIIATSAYEDREYLIHLINIGIDGFMQKPSTPENMINIFYKVCLPFQFDDLQYFKALTEASIVSKSDTDGIITYVNDNFCKITGYSREEMLGRSHSMFRHPDNPDAIYKEMWETITAGKIWWERMVNLKKDGSNFIAESTIIPLVDHNGKIKEYMAIRNDVTDMVMLKREIFAKEQEKIKQEKMREAQKSFLIIFTHELKTPLNAIINFTKYIKKQIEQPKEQNREKLLTLLGSVLNNASDMLENITNILDISKLNAGKIKYTYALFSANDLIADALRKFDSLIEDKNIKVTCHTDEEIFIYSDEQRVKQIFSNIFSNAVKYGNGEIIITLSSDRKKVVMSIEDNGNGIKDKEGIFDLYAQEDENLLQRKGQGTGVGLYFLKLLCQDLHIAYSVEDRDEGTGTRFLLSFDSNPKKLQED